MHSLLMVKHMSEPDNQRPLRTDACTILNIVQVNALFAQDMAQFAETRPSNKDDHATESARIAKQWSLFGACLTPMDPAFEYRKPVNRALAVQKRGQMDCENIWGDELSIGDSCYLVVRVTKANTNDTVSFSMLDSAVHVTFKKECWYPQICALSSLHAYPKHAFEDSDVLQLFQIGTCFSEPRRVTRKKARANLRDETSPPIISMARLRDSNFVPVLFDI